MISLLNVQIPLPTLSCRYIFWKEMPLGWVIGMKESLVHKDKFFLIGSKIITLGIIQLLRHAVVAPTSVGKNDSIMMHRGGW